MKKTFIITVILLIMTPFFLFQHKSSENISLIVFSGESNSGGRALNSDLNTFEKSAKPYLQILNNQTFLFEDLQIGVNNLIDHYGMPAYITTTEHSWENGLVKKIEDSTITDKWLVKTGQGGSTIAQWNDGGTYWTKFQQRVDAAISILNITKDEKFVLFYTQGINDALAGTNITTWKTATKAHFAKIRAKYGNVPIFIPLIRMSTVPNVVNYDNAIIEICSEISDCYYVETSGFPQQDNYHWNYIGQKNIAELLVNKAKEKGFL